MRHDDSGNSRARKPRFTPYSLRLLYLRATGAGWAGVAAGASAGSGEGALGVAAAAGGFGTAIPK